MIDPLPSAISRAVDARTDGLDIDPRALLTGATARAVRRRRTRSTGAVVAAAIAVAGVTAAGPLLFQQAREPAPVSTVPPGQQAVSWHGVQVLVPAAWRLQDTRCGTPQSHTVLRPGSVDSCMSPPVRGLTVVEFAAVPDDVGSPSRALGDVLAATEPVDLGGVPARRGTVTTLVPEPDGVRRVLVVPSEQVVLAVQAPTIEEADAVLRAARVVRVDAQGCASRLPSSRPEPRPRSSRASVLPAATSSVRLCRYAALRLEESRRLSGQQVAALRSRLNGLPTGRAGDIPPREIDATYCRSLDDDVTTITADVPDGPGVQVVSRHAACTDRSVTDGNITRRPDQMLGADLARLLRGEPLLAPAPRVQPAPELGYAGLPGRRTLPAPGQRADLLARTDNPADGRLLGIRLQDGRRCLLLAASEATPVVDCAAQTATLQTLDDATVWAGTTLDRVRSVRVLIDGRQVAVVPTHGSGAEYGQRRAFLVRLPSGSSPSFKPLDGLGREVR